MAREAPVIIVHLRQPMKDANEARTDPLYEFGSFGLTGCHAGNLLHDRGATGARLAFVQPGDGEMRLVMVTPPVEVRCHAYRNEACWQPGGMPLRFTAAPILIDNFGRSEVAGFTNLLRDTNRPTPVARFSSKFRSRKKPLPSGVAANLVAAWERAAGEPQNRAVAYWEALPWMPPNPDRDRYATYENWSQFARGGAQRAVATSRTVSCTRVPRSGKPGGCSGR